MDAQPVATSARRRPIDVAHVSRWYGNVVAVNDVSISIGPGVTGLLGPNGAGKSTLLHLAAGLLAPSVGSVTILGAAGLAQPGDVPAGRPRPGARERATPFLTGPRVRASSTRVCRACRTPTRRRARAIGIVDLQDAADRPIGTYSKGMRQRDQGGRRAGSRPAVLLLDEPFNGMDPRQRLHMMELLRRWPPRAARSSSPRTSSRRWSGWPRTCWSSSPAGSPPPATSARSGGS